MKKYLFLDDRVVKETKNAVLKVGKIEKSQLNPLFSEDNPWEVRFDNLYANIYYNDELKKFQCWYSPFIVHLATKTYLESGRKTWLGEVEKEMAVCYSESVDGIKWSKPDLGLESFEGSKSNNIVIRNSHGAGILYDEHTSNLDEKYKMIYIVEKAIPDFNSLWISFSKDGLKWSEPFECPNFRALNPHCKRKSFYMWGGDMHNNALWVPELNKYVMITRMWAVDRRTLIHKGGVRVLSRCESSDFKKWTDPEPIIEGEKIFHQTYSMPMFRYHGYYLGLLQVYDIKAGRVHTELVGSSDTVTWKRIDEGNPIIPLGENRGDYDWGTAYAALSPLVMEDDIWIYYGGCNGTHSGYREGFLCLAKLRIDGFAGYEPNEKEKSAEVSTHGINLVSENIAVSADVFDEGSIEVLLLNSEGKTFRSESIIRNVTDGLLKWSNPEGIESSKEQLINLKFLLKNAKIYSFSFV